MAPNTRTARSKKAGRQKIPRGNDRWPVALTANTSSRAKSCGADARSVSDGLLKLAQNAFCPEDFTAIDVGRERLREALKDRQALLVLDAVWRRDDAEAFNIQGPRFRLLLTTRDAGLVTALAAKENHYRVHLPTEAEARSMLASAAGANVEALPAEANDVIVQCGRLPLGLTLCGGMVYGGTKWRDILAAFRARKLTYISDEHELDPNHRDIWTAMDMSLRALPAEESRRFAELAVFAMDARTPEEAVCALWEHTAQMDALDARALIAKFGPVANAGAGRAV